MSDRKPLDTQYHQHIVTVEVDTDDDWWPTGWVALCNGGECMWISEAYPLDDTGANAAWAAGQGHMSEAGGKVIPLVPGEEKTP